MFREGLVGLLGLLSIALVQTQPVAQGSVTNRVDGK